MNSYAQEIDQAIRIARQAGTILMKIYATEFSVEFKGYKDPVTEADTQANALIVKELAQAFPQDLIVAEESPPPIEKSATSRMWYVDPMDGTKEFIAKNGEFSVMIGLAVNGQAHLGVVYRPDRDLLYAGVVGQEAWREQNSIQTSLTVDPTKESGSTTLTVSRSHRNPLVNKIKSILGVTQEMTCGSIGLKIGLIAEGKADLYLEPGPYTSLWDACGPEAILKAAGGEFTNVFGQPMQYGIAQLKNTHGIVASNGANHEQIIQALKPVVEELGLKRQEL
jgi:3'(2'), 5'-bisphosphate nucleotidase